MPKVRPSLRIVIGVVVAVTVVVVAALTLAITYTITVGAVRDIGEIHALALASTAKLATQEHFEKPARDLDTWQALFGYDDWGVPSEDPRNPDPDLLDGNFYHSYQFMRKRNFTYGIYALMFDEFSSSNSFVRPFGGATSTRKILYWEGRSAWQYPAQNMPGKRRAVDVTTGLEISQADLDAQLPAFQTNSVARFTQYDAARAMAPGDGTGFWYNTSLFYPAGAAAPAFSLPAIKPMYNATLPPRRFVGLAIAQQPVGILAAFLADVKAGATENTQAFIIDGSRRIVASTHPVSFFTITTTVAGGAVPTGCASTVETDRGFDSVVSLGCRSLVTDFSAYPPIVAAAEVDGGSFVMDLTAPDRVKAVAIDGEGNFFVAVATIRNSYRHFDMRVVVCLPEADILGNVVAGRNLGIIVTAVILVIVTAIVLFVVNLLLQPLTDVSRKMLDTAKLKEPENVTQVSRLEEVAALQRSYANMNTAISNFTRYVPRDVVKDLMSSGQLCTIQMIPQTCTMLFVDIAGFTSVCERVPPDALSELVSRYFDRASRLVMEHDGLIDKFIGDCIMAVWGAPFAISNQEAKATLCGLLINRCTIAQPLSGIWDEAGEILRVRVGVSTGEVLAGNMGSADRMNYTVIGDPVNLAARLESLNKQFDTRVMVSEMTAEGLGGVFVLRLLMPIAVVGKDKPVKAYEVLGLSREIPPEDVERLQEVDDDYGVAGDSEDSELDMKSAISIRSQMSVQEAAEKKRKGSKATLVMIREAAMQTAADTPVSCTMEQQALAQQHTAAVHLYLNGQFVEAIAALDAMKAKLPASLFETNDRQTTVAANPTLSMQIVRGLCEDYARDGAPADFDGVYRALEK